MNLANQPSQFDKDILKFHNQARTNPKSYIPILEKMLASFDGLIMRMPGVNRRTREGAPAVQELINFMKKQAPIPALGWRQEMVGAPRDQVNDRGPKGLMGHTGSDGSSSSDRMNRYIKINGYSGECIEYGEMSAQQVIIALLIDDGVANRGHRTAMFTKEFTQMAAYTGFHKNYKKMTVIDYTGPYPYVAPKINWSTPYAKK